MKMGGSPKALLWILAMVATLFQSSSHCAFSLPKDSRKRQDVSDQQKKKQPGRTVNGIIIVIDSE